MTSLPILTYHRLLAGESTHANDPQRIAVSAAQFRSHLTWLKRMGYKPFPLEKYPALLRSRQEIPQHAIGITFDDGYEEVLTIGLPILREFGFTATVFAVSGELGGTNRWDDGQAKLLTAEQYQRLMKSGITVGSHTRHHVHLTKEFDPRAVEELQGSKKDLEAALGAPVTLLAYPYGETNDRVDRLAEQAGYDAAFATDQAPANHRDNLYRLRRAVVFPKNNPFEILLKVQPWYFRFQDWKRGQLSGK